MSINAIFFGLKVVVCLIIDAVAVKACPASADVHNECWDEDGE